MQIHTEGKYKNRSLSCVNDEIPKFTTGMSDIKNKMINIKNQLIYSLDFLMASRIPMATEIKNIEKSIR